MLGATIDRFEKSVRERLKKLSSEDKLYLKKNYVYELFVKHGIHDAEVAFLFDMKKILRISQNLAFPERIDSEINSGKNRRIKIVFVFDPVVNGKKASGKVGVVTAFII